LQQLLLQADDMPADKADDDMIADSTANDSLVLLLNLLQLLQQQWTKYISAMDTALHWCHGSKGPGKVCSSAEHGSAA